MTPFANGSKRIPEFEFDSSGGSSGFRIPTSGHGLIENYLRIVDYGFLQVDSHDYCSKGESLRRGIL